MKSLEIIAVSNKINGVETAAVRIAPGGATVRPATGNSGGKADDGSNAPVGDVQITGTARHLAALEQSIRELPAIDEARVAAVLRRLEDGSYSVDSQRVADKLLRMDAELDFKS